MSVKLHESILWRMTACYQFERFSSITFAMYIIGHAFVNYCLVGVQWTLRLGKISLCRLKMVHGKNPRLQNLQYPSSKRLPHTPNGTRTQDCELMESSHRHRRLLFEFRKISNFPRRKNACHNHREALKTQRYVYSMNLWLQKLWSLARNHRIVIVNSCLVGVSWTLQYLWKCSLCTMLLARVSISSIIGGKLLSHTRTPRGTRTLDCMYELWLRNTRMTRTEIAHRDRQPLFGRRIMEIEDRKSVV